MKIALFDAHDFEREYFEAANHKHGHLVTFFDVKLNEQTASLTHGFDAVCPFVNDRLNETTLTVLAANGIKLVALRSAGFNNVNLEAATRLGIEVVRVPEYSPYAVAEHAVALILSLNRKIYRAYARVRDGNFLLDGLVGFDLHGKTAAVLGTGKIGKAMLHILHGFGCNLTAFDLRPDHALERALGVRYLPIPEIYQDADIISLHVPLTPATKHMINSQSIKEMKKGVMLINTGRGALVETQAMIEGLKSGQIGSAGLDVYEEEEHVFFKDLSSEVLQDDALARLLTFPNVMVTAHQAFLTREALTEIAETTLQNAADFEQGKPLVNSVRPADVVRKAA